MKTFRLLILIFGYGLLAAAECHRDQYIAYDKMDRNGDGIVSSLDFQIQAGETFHFLRLHGCQKRSHRTHHLDMNDNGWVDQGDYKEVGDCKAMVNLRIDQKYEGCSVAKLSAIARFDVNKDGDLSVSEKNAFFNALNTAIMLSSQLNNRAPVYERYQIADLNNDGAFNLEDDKIFKEAIAEFAK